MGATKAVTSGVEDTVRAVSRIRHVGSCRDVKTLGLCSPNNGSNCCLSVSFFFHQWRNTQFYVPSMWRIFWSQSRMDKGSHVATFEEKSLSLSFESWISLSRAKEVEECIMRGTWEMTDTSGRSWCAMTTRRKEEMVRRSPGSHSDNV